MKKLLLFPVLLLFTFFGFSQTNLVPNGDLENWTAGNLDEWVSQEGDVSEETVEVTSGNKSALLIETRNTVEPTIVSKNFLFEAGKTYNLHIDFKVKTGRTPFGQQVIGFKYGPISSFPIVSNNLIPQGFDWETRDFEIEVTTTEEWKLEVSAFTFADELFEVYIDNINIFDPNETNPDRDALIALYNATNGPNWTNSWDLNADISTWYGVTIDENGRVIELNLQSNNLIGSLPSEVGDLTELQVLLLNQSFWVGTINNKISGNLPIELGLLQNLKNLNLASNEIDGVIPNELGQLSHLEYLDLRNNSIVGVIPIQLGLISNLEEIDLAYNSLSGSIPSEFGQLTNLKYLDLANNNLSGEIPSEFGQLSNLEGLNLCFNSLLGAIPNELGQLSNLFKLELHNNNFSGEIPFSIGGLGNVGYMTLMNNNISGEIPSSFGQLTNLVTLGLSNNNLNGGIPEELGLLTELSVLYLSSNQLEGIIPEAIGKLNKLKKAFFHQNKLSGKLPVFTSNKIELILVDENEFVFEDLEEAIDNQANFRYAPQANIGDEQAIELNEGEGFTISVTTTTSENNTYQWTKNGVDIDGAINPIFSISEINVTNSGQYGCKINNNILTELELSKNAITLNVIGNDADNDGISNENDNCPNTPTGETVDANGCSPSQLDDDNDGVSNNLDLCPNTPTGTSVDADGCPFSTGSDADNDGIDDANDTCPDTPTGETVNAAGCSESQLDDDNDGVTNDQDNCPNTPTGETVDASGCPINQENGPDIANTDIQVKVTSTTCEGSSNGEIAVQFNKSFDYTATLTSANFNMSYDDINQSSGLSIVDLATGSYQVCIGIATFPDFERCFTVQVETPEDFISGKTSVDLGKKTAQLVVSGSTTYKVFVNETSYEFNFSSTGNNQLNFDLTDGLNKVKVKTDKECQGVYEEVIIINTSSVYPNPTADMVNIVGLINSESSSVTISDINGVAIRNYQMNISNASLSLSIEDFPAGIYLIRIESEEQNVLTKVIKR